MSESEPLRTQLIHWTHDFLLTDYFKREVTAALMFKNLFLAKYVFKICDVSFEIATFVVAINLEK